MPDVIPEKYLNFLGKLHRVTEHKKGACWSAQCPAHLHDTKPSLSINVGRTGNLVVTCHSASGGCAVKDIVAAVGMSMSDLFAGDKPGFERTAIRSRPYPDEVYPYYKADGRLAYETCRYNNPKNFAARRPNPAWLPRGIEPRYLWNLDGVELILYRLPVLLEAWGEKPDRWTFLVEGERKADALDALGLLATSHALGAGHWSSDYAVTLAGRNVVIFYDVDPYQLKQRKRPGQAWAVQAARDLVAAGCKVRICRPPGCRDDSKDDIGDFIGKNPGLTTDEIVKQIRMVVNATADYYPGWETDTGFAVLQTLHRARLGRVEPGDMNEVMERVHRRLGVALDGIRLDSLPDDLGETAAWCQWLAELLRPRLLAVNIQLGPTPAQTSEPKPEGANEPQDATETQDPTGPLCLPAQEIPAQGAAAEFVEPEPV